MTTQLSRPAPLPGALPSPPARRLPDGFTVRLDRRIRWLEPEPGQPIASPVLLGGSPTRVLRLAPVAARLLADRRTLTVADRTSAALAARLLAIGAAHPVLDRCAPKPTPGEVTAVIPVKDRPDGLRRLLAALAETAPGLAEVIVVDDGSADPDRCRDIAEAAGARLLRHERSRGPSAARNTGLARSGTEYTVFLDSDVAPQPGWLDPLLAHLADPMVALVAPRVTGVPAGHRTAGRRGGWLDRWLHRYEGLRSSLDLGPESAPVLPRTRVAYVPSAALLVRRRALADGFDPRMRVAEDVDLVLRLHAAGWRMRYEPSSVVAHEHRVRPADWWLRKAFYGTGAAPLAARHPDAVPPAVLAPWTVAALGLAAVPGRLRPLGICAATGVTALAVARLRRELAGVRHPERAAARLAAIGLGAAAGQLSGLLTRHWWPLTALGAAASRRFRRLALLVAVVDGLVDWWTDRRQADGGKAPGLDPIRYLLARRADDLGYGAGLWYGALRARSVAALRPVLARRAR